MGQRLTMIIPMVPSTEGLERIKLLLSLGRFGENTQDALIRHFVGGLPVDNCCCIYSIAQPNLQRSVTRLNEINHIVQSIKDIDLYIS